MNRVTSYREIGSRYSTFSCQGTVTTKESWNLETLFLFRVTQTIRYVTDDEYQSTSCRRIIYSIIHELKMQRAAAPATANSELVHWLLRTSRHCWCSLTGWDNCKTAFRSYDCAQASSRPQRCWGEIIFSALRSCAIQPEIADGSGAKMCLKIILHDFRLNTRLVLQ